MFLTVLATLSLLQDPPTRTEVGEALRSAIEAQVEAEAAEAAMQEAIDEARRRVAEADAARRRAEAADELAQELLDEYIASLTAPPEPPSTGRPGEDLDWSVRPKPSEAELDWIVQGGVFTSRRGLLATDSYGDAYRQSRADGDTHIVFGIHDARSGTARVGGTWNQYESPENLVFAGDDRASATFVGLSDIASIHLAFGSHHDRAMRTGRVMAFDIGLIGSSDSFAIRANGGADHVQLDGCWFIHHDPDWNYANQAYASGLHIDNWGTLVLRNWKWRGPLPGSPGLKLREHVFYLKGGRVSTLIENCDLFGGNRTGFQKRPDAENQPLPTDRLMVRNNRIENHGTNHEFSDGGACFTVWVSSAGTYIYDNLATNFRYKALVISGQSSNKNWGFLPSGCQHNLVHVAGNRFIPGEATERGTVGISSVQELHIWDNDFEGRVTLDSEWNFNQNGTSNQRTFLHHTDALTWDIWKYDPQLGRERAMTEAEVRELLP